MGHIWDFLRSVYYSFWLGEPKWNRKLIFKSPIFVQFGANLTHVGPKSGHCGLTFLSSAPFTSAWASGLRGRGQNIMTPPTEIPPNPTPGSDLSYILLFNYFVMHFELISSSNTDSARCGLTFTFT